MKEKTECKHIKELIQAYIDKEISEPEKVTLENHIKECENCAKELELAKKSSELLTTNIIKEELPPYFEAKFWARVENTKAPEGIFISKRLISRLAGAMLVILGTVLLFRTTEAPAPDIYIVSPQPNHIVTPDEATISAAFYPKPKEGSVSLILNGKTIDPILELTDDNLMYTSEEPLKEGYYNVSVQIKDKKGNVKSEKKWLFYVIP